MWIYLFYRRLPPSDVSGHGFSCAEKSWDEPARDRHWNEVKAEGARSKRVLSRNGKYHVLPHRPVGTGSLLFLEEFRANLFQRFL